MPGKIGQGRWLEEYRCGCSNVTTTKKDALGHCPMHGTDSRHVIKLTAPVEVGYAGKG